MDAVVRGRKLHNSFKIAPAIERCYGSYTLVHLLRRRSLDIMTIERIWARSCAFPSTPSPPKHVGLLRQAKRVTIGLFTTGAVPCKIRLPFFLLPVNDLRSDLNDAISHLEETRLGIWTSKLLSTFGQFLLGDTQTTSYITKNTKQNLRTIPCTSRNKTKQADFCERGTIGDIWKRVPNTRTSANTDNISLSKAANREEQLGNKASVFYKSIFNHMLSQEPTFGSLQYCFSVDVSWFKLTMNPQH